MLGKPRISEGAQGIEHLSRQILEHQPGSLRNGGGLDPMASN
jgi:hypothetical protein